MDITDLSRGIFGYKKEDVYEFFSLLSADFSQQLKSIEKEKDLKINALEDKIALLEASLETAQKEKDAKISALENSISLLRTSLATAQKENAEAKKRTGLMVSSIGNAQQQAKQLTHQLEQLWENFDMFAEKNGKA